MAENRQPVGELVHRTPSETKGPLINPALVGCAGLLVRQQMSGMGE